jgi:hypothetical protein
LEKLERSGTEYWTSLDRYLNFKRSGVHTSGATADLGNRDNLAGRGRLHKARLGTIVVHGKMYSNHGELLKTRDDASHAAVEGHPPQAPQDPSLTWRRHNYLTDAVAIDMFIVATADVSDPV